MSIDLRKLKYIREIAKAGSITSAASAMRVTQSALTRSIAEVESTVGISLFQRLPRGVRLTDAGKRFVEKAERILRDVDELLYDLEDYRSMSTGSLVVAVTPSNLQAFIADHMAQLAHQYPGIHIEFLSGSTEWLAPKLLSGDIDFIISSSSYLQKWPDLERQVLSDFYSAVLIRRDHPLTHLKKPSELDVLKYPFVMPESVELIHSDLQKRYIHHQLPPLRPQYITSDRSMLQALITNTDAFSIIFNLAPSFDFVRKEFAALQDVVKLPKPQLVMALAKGRELTPAAKAFIDLLQANQLGG